MSEEEQQAQRERCQDLQDKIFARRNLIIAANRGPVTFQTAEDGSRTFTRGSGGLVTALLGLAQHIDASWIACARTDADAEWERGDVPLWAEESIRLQFLPPDPEAYEGYYNVIANPLLWFLQHSMWDIPRKPVIDRSTWLAWSQGYTAINRQFADAIVKQVRRNERPTLVMLQDYHLYLVGRMVRTSLRPQERPLLLHFIHIPWPGPDYWSILPPDMRTEILEGLLGVDILGFQTRDDGLNFMRTCQRFLPRVGVRYNRGRVWYRNHATIVRPFPISIDVDALHETAASEQVATFRRDFAASLQDGQQLILRIERIEPSKNIVRGFQAYEEMLTTHPEHRGSVKFLAILVPSRMDLGEYRNYLDEVMAAVGRINAKFGSGEWEPVRVLVGENYERAVAAMQLYDVLLVNSVADGMNLVAKEGPVVNQRHGQLVLSDRTGAREQLQEGSFVISPCDVHATAEALHEAMTTPLPERQRRAELLRALVEEQDIFWWLCSQLETVVQVQRRAGL